MTLVTAGGSFKAFWAGGLYSEAPEAGWAGALWRKGLVHGKEGRKRKSKVNGFKRSLKDEEHDRKAAET